MSPSMSLNAYPSASASASACPSLMRRQERSKFKEEYECKFDYKDKSENVSKYESEYVCEYESEYVREYIYENFFSCVERVEGCVEEITVELYEENMYFHCRQTGFSRYRDWDSGDEVLLTQDYDTYLMRVLGTDNLGALMLREWQGRKPFCPTYSKPARDYHSYLVVGAQDVINCDHMMYAEVLELQAVVVKAAREAELAKKDKEIQVLCDDCGSQGAGASDGVKGSCGGSTLVSVHSGMAMNGLSGLDLDRRLLMANPVNDKINLTGTNYGVE
ncbi:hypothetical protein BDK51DRAFT_42349 [Blyttiomyces helicus]|uniref:Uncharacterized protein n=1 Tax=Blyttiomyces helicus TaxID=388810 RepID=A0A4V1ISI3_9FUNG|nr:hypothetical protein BDK51DRAFT_42349 [Blyttiomyces helicus]|eukprot:RKO93657.1 hypothetical protein BDK51DRAFT_42349 [Blyttiomyces helicus]